MTANYTWDWFTITILILNAITILLHGSGVWYNIIKRIPTTSAPPIGTNSTSLSINNTIKNNIELISMSLSIILSSLASTASIVSEIVASESRFALAASTALLIPFYCSMIFLTLQRFFAIRLHLRYESSWIFLQRVNITLTSWLACVTTLVTTVPLLFVLTPQKTVLLTWSLIGIVVLGLVTTNIVFVAVYAYIYTKYRRANKSIQRTMYRKKKAKIFTPFIICISFFLFGTLPHTFMPQVNDNRFSFLWFNLDCIANSLVYFFSSAHMRRRWTRWWLTIRPNGRGNRVTGAETADSSTNMTNTSGTQHSETMRHSQVP